MEQDSGGGVMANSNANGHHGKQLGLLELFCLATGAMVSSGLFILPGLAHAEAGPAVVFSYLLAGLLAGTGVLSIAELITAMPKAGGDYFFIMRTLGPAAGSVTGLLAWFSLTLKSTFALVGIGAFLALMTDYNPLFLIIPICAGFVLLNIVGSKEAGGIQVFLVVLVLGLICLYAVYGASAVNVDHFKPVAPHGWHAVFSTTGLVFVSYGGLLKLASVADEVRDPVRNIPRAMFLSLAVGLVSYTVLVFITSGVLGPEQFDHSLTPISDAAAAVMGKPGMIVMSAGAILAFVSAANAGIMAASRYLLSLSRDGLLPPVFGAIHPRFGTPHAAVITTGIALVVTLFLDMKVLVKAASTVLILTYILSHLCVVVIRESRLANYRPKFRSPFYPWPQVAGIAGYGMLVLEMGYDSLLICLALVAGALLYYWLYGRIRQEREYALMHLVERLTDKVIAQGLLESELKSIVRERDQLCVDRFDQLVEKARVLDFDEPMDAGGFFSRMAAELAPIAGLEAADIESMLREREQRGSTEVVPGVSVSDLIVRGEGKFEIVLARMRGGVVLEPGSPHVKAFFLLLVSEDERYFYLKTIAAIAQIIQHPAFEKRWRTAANEQNLKDILLLSERPRACEIDPPGMESPDLVDQG